MGTMAIQDIIVRYTTRPIDTAIVIDIPILEEATGVEDTTGRDPIDALTEGDLTNQGTAVAVIAGR